MLDNAEFARIVREFLDNPRSEHALSAFFELAFHYIRARLRLYQATGWRLPLEEFSDESAIDDLALDLLFDLHEKKGRLPFHQVHEYLKPRIGPDIPDTKVVALTKGQWKRHTKQHLVDLQWGHRPERGKTRRRINEITDGPEYELIECPGGELVRWKSATNPMREDYPLLDDGEFYTMAAAAIRYHTLMPQRCRHFFGLLDRNEAVMNAVLRHRLVSVFCRVLDDFARDNPSSTHSSHVQYVRARARELAQTAITEVMANDFAHFRVKRGFDDCLAARYEAALINLTNDIVEHGDHDPLPRYLKEQLGDQAECYLDNHKHTWETIVNRTLERWRELMRAEGLDPE